MSHEKNTLSFSIESCLVDKDPYTWLMKHNPYISLGRKYHPLGPNQPGALGGASVVAGAAESAGPVLELAT